MKRLLIEMHQEHLIVCDNKECDYKIPSETGNPNDSIVEYLNKPCPKCGKNLLTEEDYLQSLQVLSMVNWLNKWFSWIMFFAPKKSKRESVSVHCHRGIKIKKLD